MAVISITSTFFPHACRCWRMVLLTTVKGSFSPAFQFRITAFMPEVGMAWRTGTASSAGDRALVGRLGDFSETDLRVTDDQASLSTCFSMLIRGSQVYRGNGAAYSTVSSW